MPVELPARARCVIVGGGVGGTSIAYHLAQLGYRDVLLLERAELTSGSTFHSAGLVGQLRGSVTLTRMMMHSVELYRTLDCGWVQCGGIRLACTPERFAALRLMRAVSDLREGMWGVLQGVISDLEFDFAAYADEHLRRGCETIADPRFEEWLARAG